MWTSGAPGDVQEGCLDLECWLAVDNDGGYGTLTDELIVATCLNKGSIDDYENTEQSGVISQGEATFHVDE